MIEASGIKKDFRDSTGDGFVLNSISLALNKGRITGIVGSNGSGKSTLLKILGGVIERDGGSVMKRDINKGTSKNYFADGVKQSLYLDQDAGRDVVPSMTVIENLSLAQVSSLAGTMRMAAHRKFCPKAEYAIRTVGMGLEKNARQQVRFLSGGERQGLVLARTLILEPEVLLLDEFVSAVARNLSLHLMTVVKNLVEARQCYCVLVSHDVDLVVRFSDDIVFLHDGNILDSFRGGSDEARKQVLELLSQCLKQSIRT